MKKVLLLGAIPFLAVFAFAQPDIQKEIEQEASTEYAIPLTVNLEKADEGLHFESSSDDDDLFGGSSDSDDDLFGGDDDLFGDDALFGDDGIEIIEDTSAKDGASKGVLFEAGSVKVGGRLNASLNTNTALYNPDEKKLGENIKNTTLSPTLNAMLSVDARPTETLRMYTKFGMGYPFNSTVMLNLSAEDMATIEKLAPILDSLKREDYQAIIDQIMQGNKNNGESNPQNPDQTPEQTPGQGNNPSIGEIIDGILNGGNKDPAQNPNNPDKTPDEEKNPDDKESENKTNIADLAKKISIKDWFKLKELFTDFSIKDRAFFRFGLHTVSWGAGYFFSPVSDMINTSQIDPENPTEQVDGSLNLRTQIIFPGTQNCLWLYLVPSTDFSSGTTAMSYARDTALAAKYDLVLGDWELGFGAYWKYQNAPKAMMTATGSVKKISLFGEAVYQYGASSEWEKNKEWGSKTNIFHLTAGGFYSWNKPGIMLGMQYYYDSNDKDFMDRIYTNGHNIALMANFSKFGSFDKLNASVFGIVNFGRAGLTEEEKTLFDSMSKNGAGAVPELPCLMINANFIYRPVDDISLSLGPSMVFTSFEKKPVVSVKFGVNLGGGKF